MKFSGPDSAFFRIITSKIPMQRELWYNRARSRLRCTRVLVGVLECERSSDLAQEKSLQDSSTVKAAPSDDNICPGL